MKVLKKIKVFLFLDMNIKLLLIEAFFLLGWARIVKGKPFSTIAPSLGEQMKETSFNLDDSNIVLLDDISNAINIMSKYTIWESMCLVKAIAAMKMLERRKIESTLYLGTGKDERGKLIAHAWLRSGPYYITGFEVMNRFTVVGTFAKKIN
ncbi:MAG TPA: lasso peptide biosynthesis B2 protein [Niallia sp.]|nr:lasso peptide biosynthesis B2 protein [Niallia sp.]